MEYGGISLALLRFFFASPRLPDRDGSRVFVVDWMLVLAVVLALVLALALALASVWGLVLVLVLVLISRVRSAPKPPAAVLFPHHKEEEEEEETEKKVPMQPRERQTASPSNPTHSSCGRRWRERWEGKSARLRMEMQIDARRSVR